MLERNPHVIREAKHQADEKHHSLREIAEELNARGHHIKTLSRPVAGAGSARKRESGVALFLPFRWVSTLSQRQ
jgi:hypothetical protein